jgi:hypothetical protein
MASLPFEFGECIGQGSLFDSARDRSGILLHCTGFVCVAKDIANSPAELLGYCVPAARGRIKIYPLI